MLSEELSTTQVKIKTDRGFFYIYIILLSSTDLYTTKLENMGKDTWSSLVVPSTDIDVCILYSDFANWSVFIPKNKYLQAIFILLLPNSVFQSKASTQNQKHKLN